MNKENFFIQKLKDFTASYPKVIDLSLKRVLKLLKALGNPHLDLPPIIHVAGTNGKGSTIAFMANVLIENNKKVHIYTSPHLMSISERIILSNRKVTLKELIDALDFCVLKNNNNPITQFEMFTVISFYLMAKNFADIALIETGLGGRLDATNVIKNPLLTILTSISNDHKEFLGSTLDLIAKEKAGIMKKNILCISAPQVSIVEKTLRQVSIKNKNEIVFYNKGWNVKKCSDLYKVNFMNNNYYFYKPSLIGEHQIFNAALAIVALLACNKLSFSKNSIINGIENTRWPGRLEKITNGNIKNMIHKSSEIWLDGAHNVDAVKILKKWIDSYMASNKKKSVILICGFLKNKDALSMLNHFKEGIRNIIFVPIFDNNNNFLSTDLLKIGKSYNIRSSYSNSLLDALKNIHDIKESVIIIFGSLYLIGEAYKINKS